MTPLSALRIDDVLDGMTRDSRTAAMSRSRRLPILEDSAEDGDMMVRDPRRAGYAPGWEVIEDEPAFKAALARPIDIILSAYARLRFGAPRARKTLEEHRLSIPPMQSRRCSRPESRVAVARFCCPGDTP